MYKKSDFARDALIIVSNDDSLREDYEYYNELIDYLADKLVSELNSEKWEQRSEEEKAKLIEELKKDAEEMEKTGIEAMNDG